MGLAKRLIVDARTGQTEYVEVEIELPEIASPLGGRDIIREFDDLVALLKSKGVV